MAAVVDRRFENNANAYPMNTMTSSPLPMAAPVAANSTIVQDTYGGWMRRSLRFVVFGIIGLSIVLGGFLPGIIMIGMNWNSNEQSGIRGACTNDLVVRALTTCCFFIFHALLVIPLFIKGDRAHSVTIQNFYGNGISEFWTTRTAHTAAVLQACGNLIEIALLIWTAVAFWGTGLSNQNSSCDSAYPQFRDWLWAGLIIGFAAAAISLITLRWQYTAAALRFSSNGQASYAKSAPAVLASAP